MGIGSISSASWRKGLMSQSIASYFNKRPAQDEKSPDATIAEAPRNTSTTGSDASGDGVLSGNGASVDKEKNGGMC